ncbi:hypothetical protein EMIHUDRAFT_121140 [Emiliania huxleyi CCMP1516]|uniref:Peptidase S33 tripeptidyl aminopeptidase-like C-terminal domain-containing protein n=2 Tax=Emiliania huxleyi TaxID=2903 RepID=A0A0D3I7X9_EMIH1|nr:hypothetical protein EMIHUDRAFT_121140 [Emiliania huxleyi CCMP1516]EOD07364.1 hypothetical protein EMIHUDRAFT_121140 [Emiliania huxleyi CCMP1516]|eukprot:XP_005759793.1 hypothetical protein EMIHUDRAFT_121140 [Emiliania huxleyi CCMP1516]
MYKDSLGNFDGYSNWAISQRGIGPNANPSLECAASDMQLPPDGLAREYQISDFTACDCKMPDGSPLTGQSFANINPLNASEVENVFVRMHERSRVCPGAPKWQLTGPTGKEYDFLQWVGTTMLAHDIEAFRNAICAPRMHIDGISYGTAVASTYATIFPGTTGRVVLNGNMPPDVDTMEFGTTNAGAMQQAVAYLGRLCATATYAQNSFCAWLAAEGSFGEYDGARVLSRFKELKISAPTRSGEPFFLTPGLLGGYLQEKMIEAGFVPKGWAPVLEVLQALFPLAAGGDTATSQAAEIFDHYCRLPKIDPEAPIYTEAVATWSGKRTWYEYGVCIGPQQVGLSDWTCPYPRLLGNPTWSQWACRPEVNGFMNEAAVIGLDYDGRYTVTQAMGTWQTLVTSSGADRDGGSELAVGAFVGITANIFAWGELSTPCPVAFRGDVSALIVGNLYDPATSYTWTKRMRHAFPHAVMMTWQGVGHTASAGGNYPDSGIMGCIRRISAYWKNGTLPDDGYVCHQTAAVPLQQSAVHV